MCSPNLGPAGPSLSALLWREEAQFSLDAIQRRSYLGSGKGCKPLSQVVAQSLLPCSDLARAPDTPTPPAEIHPLHCPDSFVALQHSVAFAKWPKSHKAVAELQLTPLGGLGKAGAATTGKCLRFGHCLKGCLCEIPMKSGY